MPSLAWHVNGFKNILIYSSIFQMLLKNAFLMLLTNYIETKKVSVTSTYLFLNKHNSDGIANVY